MSDELPNLPEPPEGWAVASVRSLVKTLQYGVSTKADADPKTGVPILRMGNIQDGRLDLADLKYVPRSKNLAGVRLARGDVLFNRTNSPDLVGKSAVVDVDDEMVFASYLIRLATRADAADPRYLCWWINSAWGRQWAARVKTDGVSQSNINGTKLGEMPVPVAPVPEQRRIVEKVEALLEQVNRAKGRLERVPLILKWFRQAVLAAACSGELTREWREEHACWANEAEVFAQRLRKLASQRKTVAAAEAELSVPEGWPQVSLAAASTHLTSGSRAWSPYYRDDGFGTFVMAQNVRPMRFDRSHRQGVAPPPSDPERDRTTVQQDDILVTIVGANTGDVCRVDVPVRDHFVCQSVALARPSDPSFSRFLELWLNSPLHGQRLYQEWAYGEGRPHLSFDHLRRTPVAIPGADEQVEIVRQVDRLFTVADTIERRVQSATGRAERLPQAILSKAFAGELVPTEAELARVELRAYETAEELLARVVDKRPSTSGKKAPKKSRRRGGG